MKPLLAALLTALVVPLLAASEVATASPAAQDHQQTGQQTQVRRTATTDPNPSNPLRGRWGVYRGNMDQVWAPYQRSRGETRRLLGKIMNQPRAKWLGAWIPDRDIEAKVRGYIANANGGDPDVLVTMAVFRMVPWEDEACRRVSTRAERQSYVRWIRAFVRGVGRSRTAIILQPDGPFAQCAPRGSLAHSNLLRWTSRQLAALPRSAVYLEGGNADWNHYDPDLAADLLQAGGVQYVRGFHFNTTHYESTAAQIRFGVQVVQELASRGIRHRHFTIDTGSNGRPFTWAWLKAHKPGAVFDNAPTCRDRTQTHCVTLGIPPTADVANPRWGLSDRDRALARRHVDGYLWGAKPWLNMQAEPFSMKRALAVARTTPYQ